MSGTTATEPSAKYLVLPDTVAETTGAGPAWELGPLQAKRVLVALHIADIIEQESLQVSIWGSADGANWGEAPLVAYPQKFYAGVSPAAVDLGQRPEIGFLQARWKVNRWGRGYPRPHFQFSVEIEELASR